MKPSLLCLSKQQIMANPVETKPLNNRVAQSLENESHNERTLRNNRGGGISSTLARLPLVKNNDWSRSAVIQLSPMTTSAAMFVAVSVIVILVKNSSSVGTLESTFDDQYNQYNDLKHSMSVRMNPATPTPPKTIAAVAPQSRSELLDQSLIKAINSNDDHCSPWQSVLSDDCTSPNSVDSIIRPYVIVEAPPIDDSSRDISSTDMSSLKTVFDVMNGKPPATTASNSVALDDGSGDRPKDDNGDDDPADYSDDSDTNPSAQQSIQQTRTNLSIDVTTSAAPIDFGAQETSSSESSSQNVLTTTTTTDGDDDDINLKKSYETELDKDSDLDRPLISKPIFPTPDIATLNHSAGSNHDQLEQQMMDSHQQDEILATFRPVPMDPRVGFREVSRDEHRLMKGTISPKYVYSTNGVHSRARNNNPQSSLSNSNKDNVIVAPSNDLTRNVQLSSSSGNSLVDNTNDSVALLTVILSCGLTFLVLTVLAVISIRWPCVRTKFQSLFGEPRQYGAGKKAANKLLMPPFTGGDAREGGTNLFVPASQFVIPAPVFTRIPGLARFYGAAPAPLLQTPQAASIRPPPPPPPPQHFQQHHQRKQQRQPFPSENSIVTGTLPPVATGYYTASHASAAAHIRSMRPLSMYPTLQHQQEQNASGQYNQHQVNDSTRNINQQQQQQRHGVGMGAGSLPRLKHPLGPNGRSNPWYV